MVKEATTVLDEFTGVRPEVVNTVLRVRVTLGEAKLGAHPRDVAGDAMLARYHGANAPAIGADHGAENHVIHLAAIVNSGLAERQQRGADVARDAILKKDMVRARRARFLSACFSRASSCDLCTLCCSNRDSGPSPARTRP